MIPAGELGGRSSRKEEDTQKKKIKDRAAGNINECLDTVRCVLILCVFYTDVTICYVKVQILE